MLCLISTTVVWIVWFARPGRVRAPDPDTGPGVARGWFDAREQIVAFARRGSDRARDPSRVADRT